MSRPKLAGTDEGKILDDIHGICYVREGKPCAGKRDVLNRCPASMNTKRSPKKAVLHSMFEDVELVPRAASEV